MIDFQHILAEYPQALHANHRKNIAKEYLQYFLLDAIFSSPLGNKLSFIGGTNLRIVHKNMRFSEDLDFDNTGISLIECEQLATDITRYFSYYNIVVETKVFQKKAYHIDIKFPDVLTHRGLTPYTRKGVREKLVIKFDTHEQGYKFSPETTVIDRFGVKKIIQVAPLPLLMAHKIFTIGNRKQSKGRDYFDLIFLQKKHVKPDYGYLKQFLGIETPAQVKEYLLDIISKKDKNRLIRDVQPFLFNPYDDSIKHFEIYVEQYEW